MMNEYNPFETGQTTDLDDAPTFNNARIEIRTSSEPQEYTTELPSYYDNGLPTQVYKDNVMTTAIAGPSTSRDFSEIEVLNDSTVISTQPTSHDVDDHVGQRKIIPVYTMGWRSTPHSQFLPLSGLDFLTGVQQIQINETVQDLHNRAMVSNRYTIKVPNGETLYVAQESSTEMQRSCCGNLRAFTMTLHDPSRQEAASFIRNIGCTLGCFGCCLQEMEIYTPPGEYLGRVQQQLTLIGSQFYIKDGYNVLFRVEGPNALPCLMFKDATFHLLSGDGQAKLGSITRTWDETLGDYNLRINFPAPGTPENQKILIIACAFLLEYMYFEEKKKCFCACC